MNELRRDPITGRWVIVFTEKIPRPEDFKVERNVKKKDGCPFCWGAEQMTPPEITALRRSGGPNTPGWTIRVVPNKYPALKIEGDLDKRGVGMYDMMNGTGAHEVIVETPDHFKELADLSYGEIEQAIWMYINRSQDLKGDTRFKYILLFKNYGRQAGASLEHSHTQLIALPIVPKRVKEELKGAAEYFDYKERCVFCDIAREEIAQAEDIVVDTKHFVAFCPFIARFPYEIWIMPKVHQSDFTLIEKEMVSDLAKTLRDSLYRMKHLLNDPPYNFIIHTGPINQPFREDFHWHIEIMPKLAKVAGFEWGSGFYINPVPPHIAAAQLRSVTLQNV